MSGARGGRIDTRPGGRVQVINHTLRDLLRIVYFLQDAQIAGFTLRWRPDGISAVNADLPSLFTAVDEQLGLRLRADARRSRTRYAPGPRVR